MKNRAALLMLLVTAGCVGDTPGGSMGPPDPSRIVVFYQLDGLVRGRGSPGALGSEAKYVYVAAHPSETVTVPEVSEDGSFFFSISASSRDLLEVAGARDLQGSERGTSIFVSIPPTPLPEVDYICCISEGASRGNCQPADAERICSASGAIINPCTSDRECAQFSGNSISLAEGAITISPPDEDGRSIIGASGKLPPFALVSIENRGQSGVGGVLPRFRTGAITSDDGSFSVRAFARADDEFVFQVHDYEGYRSLRHAVYVPDADLIGLDVVGVFPYAPLGEGRLGRVAVRYAPAGRDGLGICPDSDEGPALCFSGGKVGDGKVDGGLDFDMIRINQFKIGDSVVDDLRPAETSPLTFPANKFTDGDVLGGPQTMMLVIELSLEAFVKGRAIGQTAGPGADFLAMMSAARYFVSSLRARDQLGLVVFGLDAESQVFSEPTSDRAALFAALDRAAREAELAASVPNRNRFFRGLLGAGEKLASIPRLERGSIVALLLSDPRDTLEVFQDVINIVTPDPDTGEAGFPVYIVSAGLQNAYRATEINDVAQFSLGSYVNAVDGSGLFQAVAELTGRVSGAYILVYDLTVPLGVGKTPAVEVDAELTLPQADGNPKTVSGVFQGTLEVRDAPGP
ncbi:MAG: hypothetical protein HY791_18200 [Deltaproteobacteria bacterium]|nr:hypothetical protein [Deltaproteobacteria bacterium]